MRQATESHTTTALTVADLDTEVNCEPRILDTKLGKHLGMAQPLNIRAVIEANVDELATYAGPETRPGRFGPPWAKPPLTTEPRASGVGFGPP